MSELVFPVKPEIAAGAHVSNAQYEADAARAAADPAGCWAEHSKRVAWMTPPTKMLSGDFTGDVKIKWFEDGVLNVTESCLDRHLATRGEQVAIIPESEIQAIRMAVEGDFRVEPHPFLKCGERVRVIRGSLEGVEGILVRKKNLYRLVLSVDMMAQSVAVEIDASDVEPVVTRGVAGEFPAGQDLRGSGSKLLPEYRQESL